MQLLVDRYTSPIGEIVLVCDHQQRLRALDFVDYWTRMERLLQLHYGNYTLQQTTAPDLRGALAGYFSGALGALDGLLVETGGSPFQRAVWRALRTIPAGATTSYGALAAQLGRAGSARAVGAANGANPIAIVVPCHRVIGAQGALTGYAGGVQRKRWLLDHEASHAQGASDPSARRGREPLDPAATRPPV
jgi:methylated-DNA-[protein]-cysteine S-methyltransferase